MGPNYQGESYVYLLHILEMENIPADRATCFDCRSVAGDPVMPVIGCQAAGEPTAAEFSTRSQTVRR